jgi:predicted dehydrogenase
MIVEQATRRKPKGYADMRDVFADKNVDAVSMPVPNHWHALATIWACQAGKDVYVEKPACYNVFEGTKMIEAARKYNRMVQIGSQGRSSANRQKAMQLLHEGVIGKLYMARGLCFNRRRSIGHMADTPVPPGVDWDKFLGPAPMRPFNQLRFDYNWHWFWDTGNGDIGNQGPHQLDIAHWGLGKSGLPLSVVATGGKYIRLRRRGNRIRSPRHPDGKRRRDLQPDVQPKRRRPVLWQRRLDGRGPVEFPGL